MIDRYKYSSTFHGSSMEKRPEGDWVRAEDYDALVKAIENDLADAKAVCGGDGEGCSAYRDYYDSAERRHRKCGTCPMDALFHVRAALNPSSTRNGERNG